VRRWSIPPTRRRLAWLALLVSAVALLVLVLMLLARANTAPPQMAAPARPPPSGLPAPQPVPVAAPAQERPQRRQLIEQVRLTDHTYCSYLEQARYPYASRPAGQHPDQLYPNQPVCEANPMLTENGESEPAVRIETTQSRVYLAAGETVQLSLRAVDAQGAALPLVVTRALAQGMGGEGKRPAPRVTLAFSSDDASAWRAGLAPQQGALAGFHGTIRTSVHYQAAGRAGVVLFDVLYSPELPATWGGEPRETLGPDALEFTVPLDVRLAGRYVVSGRIDDALGRPLALASFNDALGQGAQQVRLSVHGKLLHDADPPLPLVLRDVEGYLLRENVDPDRLLLARREGRVMTSRTLSLSGVPNLEWHSEERSRYLAEYAKDRLAARARLAAFDPGAALPPGECTQPKVAQ